MNINNNKRGELVSVFENYGPLKVGCLYKIVHEGQDYYSVRCCGHNINTPKNIVNFHPELYKDQPNESEEEDFHNYLDDYYMDGV